MSRGGGLSPELDGGAGEGEALGDLAGSGDDVVAAAGGAELGVDDDDGAEDVEAEAGGDARRGLHIEERNRAWVKGEGDTVEAKGDRADLAGGETEGLGVDACRVGELSAGAFGEGAGVADEARREVDDRIASRGDGIDRPADRQRRVLRVEVDRKAEAVGVAGGGGEGRTRAVGELGVEGVDAKVRPLRVDADGVNGRCRRCAAARDFEMAGQDLTGGGGDLNWEGEELSARSCSWS